MLLRPTLMSDYGNVNEIWVAILAFDTVIHSYVPVSILQIHATYSRQQIAPDPSIGVVRSERPCRAQTFQEGDKSITLYL